VRQETSPYSQPVTVSDSAGGPRPPLLFSLSARQWLAADVLAAAAAVITALLNIHPPGGMIPMAPRGIAGITLVLLASAPVVCRRRWPIGTLAVVTGAVAALAALDRLPMSLDLMAAMASYTAAARLDRRRSVPLLLVSEAALAAVLAVASARNLAGAGIQTLLVLAAAWFIGDSVSARHSYIAGVMEQAEQRRQAEAERAAQTVRAERVRIARELHDIVAHSLAVITVQAGVGHRLMADRPAEMADTLAMIEAAGRTAQDELAVVLGLLREEDSKGADLAPAPGLADLAELADNVRAAGTPVHMMVADRLAAISPALELSAYRVIQEALTNVVKHAPGALASVTVAMPGGQLRIEITDEGVATTAPVKTAAAASPASGSGHGLAGMRERVSAFGGSLAAGPVPGGGFRVVARIPLTAEA
jgi:signal transduction histidine kinase